MQATSLTNTSPPPPRHLDVQGPRVKSEQKSFEVMRKGLFCSIERLDATLCPLLGYGELLVDKRNSIFVLVTALMLATVVPSAVALFVRFTFVHAALHLIFVMIVCAETYMAMLHNVSHRPLYKAPFCALNAVIPYVLALFFGQTWNTYFLHHVKHHHVEDNGLRDLSSTSGYQRDSLLHFLFYFVRFFLGVMVELFVYFVRRKQYALAAQTIAGETASLLLFGLLTRHNFAAGMAVFVVPYCLMRFFMMAANWGQHAFIRPEGKDAHSLTILKTSYNHVAFNDGFHASHHENSQRHWSDHPLAAISKKDASFANITLAGDINFGDVWLLLMTKNYARLEQLFVYSDVANRPSKQDIIAELRRQLMPVSPTVKSIES